MGQGGNKAGRARDTLARRRWLQDIQSGTPLDKRDAVQKLERAAYKSKGDPQAWYHLALGLAETERREDAVPILEWLVDRDPSADTFRISLSSVYSTLREFASAERHLRWVIANSPQQQNRLLAESQLAGLSDFLGRNPDDIALRDLQATALEERVSSEVASADDYHRLIRLYFSESLRDSERDWLGSATAAAYRGYLVYPTDVAILQMLVLCYMRYDPEGRLAEIIAALRQVDPSADVLRVGAEAAVFESREHVSSGKLHRLISYALSDDEQLKASAVSDLKLFTREYPGDPAIRLGLAIALSANRKHQELRVQLELLRCAGTVSFDFHFNLGQLFSSVGDITSAQHQFEIATSLAVDPSEIELANTQISALHQS
jgi:tetratricopeptide (TPR) repeat protein